MRAYYNEIDPYCCAWLRNLIAESLIAPGDVDERDIREVKLEDLRGYSQCHFFAGIAGWSLALRLSLWPDDRPVWTGSCPCQPFSAAGKQRGVEDERHLWPAWSHLIRECKPPIVFGEQVAGAIKHGWLDAVFTDLEAEGYACGASVLPACGVGAPHIRQRLWFTAALDDTTSARQFAEGQGPEGEARHEARMRLLGNRREQGVMVNAESEQMGLSRRARQSRSADCIGLGDPASDEQRGPRRTEAGDGRQGAARGSGAWSDLLWLPCTDGKQRPTQPGIFPLAHGVSARVAKLRAAGNAIAPQVAAEFIKAVM